MAYKASKQRVHNRGVPPDHFLDELVAWGAIASDDIFYPNSAKDVYSNVFSTLGPWQGLSHRRAVMLEVMRVLAGFESSWHWNEGRDTTNPTSVTPTTIEAGAWQVSANSMGFGPELKALVLAKAGAVDGNTFQRAMKANHQLAMEYIARLLRRTVNHNGPVKRHEIDRWLSKDAVAEFQSLLNPIGDSPSKANMPVTLILTRNPLNAFMHGQQSGRWGQLIAVKGPKITSVRVLSAGATEVGMIDIPTGTLKFSTDGAQITELKKYTSMERFKSNDGQGWYVQLHPRATPYRITYEAGNSAVKTLRAGHDGRCFRVHGGKPGPEQGILIHEAPHVGWLIGCISPRPLGNLRTEFHNVPGNPSYTAMDELFRLVGPSAADLFVLDW